MSPALDPQALFALMRSRRSIRRHLPAPIARALLDDLLAAACWAPSAHNRQPWRFAVVQSPARKHALAGAMGARLRADLERDGVAPAVADADVARSYARLTGAAALVVVCLTMQEMDAYPDDARRQAECVMAIQSVAMAAQNLLLAAHAAGLGACWLCAPLFAPAVVRDVLRLPASWQPQGLVTLGYPAENRTKSRKPLSEVVVYVDDESPPA